MTKDGKVERWFSYAEPHLPTVDGINEIRGQQLMHLDDLGKQARADFEWTKSRGKNKKHIYYQKLRT